MSKHLGTLSADQLARFASGPEQRAAMDAEIRRQFGVSDSRYYTVTLPPSPPGMVFLDQSRGRVVHLEKLSKSA